MILPFVRCVAGVTEKTACCFVMVVMLGKGFLHLKILFNTAYLFSILDSFCILPPIFQYSYF